MARLYIDRPSFADHCIHKLWNVWCLPSLLTDHHSRQRAEAISPLLNRYDIVILNEAFAYKDILLHKTSHPYRFIPPKPRLRIFDSGLIFLSKYPIIKCAFEQYKHTASVDSLVAKGIGLCDISIPYNEGGSLTLQVFGTHMQSERTKAAQSARCSQALQAAKFINTHRIGDRPSAVFMGDMNMGPRQEGPFSHHYSDHYDADARCISYQSMVSGSGFGEVQCEDPRYSSDICRVLIQCAQDYTLEYVDICNAAGNRLSDTDAMCLTLRLEGALYLH